MVIIDDRDIKALYFADKNNEPTAIYIEKEIQQVNPKDCLVQLQCIPSEKGKFIITELKEGKFNINSNTFVESMSGITNANEFEVYDRKNGVLRFHNSMAGRSLVISYRAIGRIVYSADRIFTNTDTTGKVVETLGDILRNCERVLADINTLGDAKVIIDQTQANIDSLKNLNLDLRIIEGTALERTLEGTISTAKTINEKLYDINVEANKTRLELDAWVEEHSDIVELDERVEGLNEKVGVLDNETKQHNDKLDNIESKVIPYINSELEIKANKSEIGSPLTASSISGMTDTTKVYVNTTDGNWYSWNGTEWVIGGVYNSQGIGEGEVTPNKTNFFEKINLFDYRTIIDGKFISSDTENESSEYYYSDFIPVEPGATYIIPYNVNNCGCFYNADKEYVANIKRENVAQPYSDWTIFKTGLATYYVKVNGFKGVYEGRTSRQPNEYMLVKGDTCPSDYIYFNNNKPYLNEQSVNKKVIKDIVKSEMINNSTNHLEGKVLACAGDSITYGANADLDSAGNPITYGYLTAKRNNMTYLNYGVSGSTLTNYGPSKAFSYDRYSKMADNIDYLTIFFGWNDFAYCNLGTIDDTQNNTFYGAWNFVLPYLIKKYPKTKIGLIIPYGTNAEWRNAVRLVAKKWGLPYLDLMSEGTPLFFEKEYEVNAEIIALRKSTFLADAVHPNNTGYEYLSTIFENWIKSL